MFRFATGVRERVREVCTEICEHEGGDWWNDELGTYCRSYAAEKSALKNLRAMEHDLGTLEMDFADKKVLDVGSGPGLISVMIALEGAAEVQAVEVWDAAVKFSRGYLSDVLKDELAVQVTCQDAACLSFPDSYFDAVICREAISHFFRPYDVLEEAARVLKPGGKLFISDGNNGSNPLIRRRTFHIWHRFENGPCGTYYCHNIKTTLREQRRDILKSSFPQFSDEQLDQLADRTFQMNADQVIQAGSRYSGDGVMPSSFFEWGMCAVEPHTGMYLENLFYPYRLAARMRKIGFDARVYAYFSHGRSPALAAASRVLEKVSFASIYMAPTFQIVARKRPAVRRSSAVR